MSAPVIFCNASFIFEPCLGAISGTVWEDLDGDGRRDMDEPREECVTVVLYNDSYVLLKTTLTDENGDYSFTDLKPGLYRVDFSDFCSLEDEEFTFKDVGDDLTDSDAYTNGLSDIVQVFPNEAVLIDAGYYMCSPIGDNVWLDGNRNNLWDLIENGVNGLRVTLFRETDGLWEEWDFTFTGQKPGSPSDDGYFKFCVPPGNYYLQIANPYNGLVASQVDVGLDDDIDSDIDDFFGPNSTESFLLSSRDGKCNIGAGFYLMATAGDICWRDDNGNGMQDNSEPGTEGVLIEVFDNLGEKVGESITNEFGEYTLDYLQQENYYFKVNPPNGMGTTIPNIGSDQMDSDADGSNGANTTPYFEMQSGMHVSNIDFGLILGVVPVEFLSFEGRNEGNYNLLKWATSSEIGNSHFEIERRKNNGNFVHVGSIDADTSPSIVNEYYYDDYDISNAGIHYYRIKQMDNNGNFGYSKTIAIQNGNSENDLFVSIYPNPFIEVLNIEIEAVTAYNTIQIEIFDLAGVLIKREVLSNKKTIGSENYKVNIETLAPGMYNLLVSIDNNEIMKKIVKLKN